MEESPGLSRAGQSTGTELDPGWKSTREAIPVTLSVADYDRTRPLLNGKVQPEGIALRAQTGEIGEFCNRPVYEAYDAAEMSFSWYVMARSRREPVVALPIFPLRMWVHAYLFCRTDSPYTHPRELVGKRVGTREYRLTVNLWIRGILKEHYGVAPEDLLWVTKDEEGAGFTIPPGLHLARRPGCDLEELLIEGEIDALLSPVVPKRFRQGNPYIRRLFPSPRSEVEGYFRRTGIFPITHTVVMSEARWKREPWIAERLVEAFREAQRQCEEFYYSDPKRLTLPRAVLILEEERAAFGRDPWTHGLEQNREVLETFVRYAGEQGYIPERLHLEDLFAPNTLTI